jgi:hypothetical protein
MAKSLRSSDWGFEFVKVAVVVSDVDSRRDWDAVVCVTGDGLLVAERAESTDIFPDDCNTVAVFLSIASVATTPLFELNRVIVSAIVEDIVEFADGDIDATNKHSNVRVTSTHACEHKYRDQQEKQLVHKGVSRVCNTPYSVRE